MGCDSCPTQEALDKLQRECDRLRVENDHLRPLVSSLRADLAAALRKHPTEYLPHPLRPGDFHA
jgi:hypothetical protein